MHSTSVAYFYIIIQPCFICRDAESTAPEDAGIEPRAVTETLTRSLGYISTENIVIISFIYNTEVRYPPPPPRVYIEPVFLNVKGAQESIPMN